MKVFAEQFLTYPDLFPTRHSGDSFGDQKLWVEFVGGPYHFEGLSPRQLVQLEERYRDLLLAPSPDVLANSEAKQHSIPCSVSVFQVDPSDFRDFDLAGWHHEIDFEHHPTSVRFAGLKVMGRLDLSETDSIRAALFTCELEGEDLLGVFENFFRIVAAYRMLQCDGVLLHSAAAVENGWTHLFLGHSGAGKTTASRLSLERGFEVLSDDVNAVSFGQESAVLQVEKLPFAGELGDRGGRSAGYPLAALYRLEKGAEHRLEPLSRARTLALLLACSPFVNHDPFRQDRLIESLQRVIDAAPSYRLTFKKDPGFWPLLMQARRTVSTEAAV